ncbi:MAG: pyridoxamine 5'-phosphate oxidase [Pseudomonadota bacterium]
MADNRGGERREYAAGELRRADLLADPDAQFADWLETALAHPVPDATAMTLATADADGVPNARIVLLKHHDKEGFVFYTDGESAKGEELAANPHATLLFYWQPLDRQVRIRGSVMPVANRQADQYFASRPLESQIAAAASHQSQPIADRTALEAEAQRFAARVPFARPQRWGGFRLRATQFEFWQGRTGRLHDRFVYLVDGERWRIERLQP